MNYDFDSAAVGTRIRQARNARGWSQEMLAEKANTTAQNISKFEKKGLSDMNWISTLSKVLDCDLLEAPIDVEGTVGEIGKEILLRLIQSDGLIYVNDLSFKLYGLSDEQLTNEIIKLAKLGLVVREAYIDWYEEECDRLFITAKGLITLKNLQLNSQTYGFLQNALKNIVTYECILCDLNSYQEYINKNIVEKLIRNIYKDIYRHPAYRIGFITYLFMSVYETTHDDVDDYVFGSGKYDPEDDRFFAPQPNNTCCEEIFYRMGRQLDNKEVNRLMNSHFFSYDETLDWFVEKYSEEDLTYYKIKKSLADKYSIDYEAQNNPYDPTNVVNLLFNVLDKFFILNGESATNDNEDNEAIMLRLRKLGEKLYRDFHIAEKAAPDEAKKISELLDIYDDLVEAVDMIETEAEKDRAFIENYHSCDLIKPENAHSSLPWEWFTTEQITDFINENFGPAQTEAEKLIDERLNKIIELKPEVLEYYAFPKEWEENGLADLVRKNAGIKKPENK